MTGEVDGKASLVASLAYDGVLFADCHFRREQFVQQRCNQRRTRMVQSVDLAVMSAQWALEFLVPELQCIRPQQCFIWQAWLG